MEKDKRKVVLSLSCQEKKPLNNIILNKFDTFHPWLRKPQDAYGKCEYVSKLFKEFYPRSKLLYLLGNNIPYPKRMDGYPAVDSNFFHCVNIVDNLVIDWSHRQLGPNCRHPFIQHLDVVKKEWINFHIH